MSEVPSQENRQFRLDRIVEVLELLSTSKEGVLLMDIVAALGIPTSTAYKPACRNAKKGPACLTLTLTLDRVS